VAALNQDADLEKRWVRAIDRAGLLNDPYGEVLGMLPEVLAAIRASGNAPLDPRVVRQVARAIMSSEERKRWMIGGAVICVVCAILAATAGWSLRDSQLKGRCMAMYQSDVCLAITR